jgi:imidazolonepropionase-like amidohydrolase
MRKFVWTLHRQGAALVAGTDAGINRVAAGTSIVDELREFEASGLSRYEALRTATVNGGELLGQPQLGTLAIGAPAELILLGANPLEDLNALRSVEGVLLQGHWRDASAVAALSSR